MSRSQRKRGFAVLGATTEDAKGRFGAPDQDADRLFIWFDGDDPTSRVALKCGVDAASVIVSVRIVLPAPRRMKTDELYRWVSRYNGGHVQSPRREPHVIGGGLPAIRFQDGYWAFPYEDPVGAIWCIQIWRDAS